VVNDIVNTITTPASTILLHFNDIPGISFYSPVWFKKMMVISIK